MDKFEQFLEVASILADPKKAEKVIADIRERENQLIAAIETVGKVNEIENIRKQIKQDKEESSAELVKAKEKAKKLEEAAVARIAKEDLRLKEYETKLMQLERDASSKLQQALAVQEGMAGRDKKLRSEEDQIKQIREQLSKDAAEVTERLDKLRQAMGA